jgi:high-affinity nickel-transport protein
VRKLYDDITTLSVAMALIIGTIELHSILGDQPRLTAGPLVAVADLNLDHVGFAIVGIFVLTRLVMIV